MITASKRLQKEYSQMKKSAEVKDEIVKLEPNPENIMRWEATIQGPKGSYYEGYCFDLAIEVPTNYPLIPPIIKFKTKIFHPNVLFENGEICLDILKKEWSPAWSLQSACRAIIALLADPAHDSPLNCDAGNMLRANDVAAYRSMSRLFCIEHAKPATP